MSIIKQVIPGYFLSIILILSSQSLLANEPVNTNNTYLIVARTQLNIASENYNKGDIDASRNNLKHASEWLYKAVNHSRSEKVKVEAEKLANEIKAFQTVLNSSRKENKIVRFWHQATSLIIRESDHLVKSYAESSTNNKIYHHLLDAKMHFYNADHELFISHESEDAKNELGQTVEYLNEANQLARPALGKHISNLIDSTNELISILDSRQLPWVNDELTHILDKTILDLNHAEKIASNSSVARLEKIKQSVIELRTDLQKTNLKTKYQSINTEFTQAINNI